MSRASEILRGRSVRAVMLEGGDYPKRVEIDDLIRQLSGEANYRIWDEDTKTMISVRGRVLELGGWSWLFYRPEFSKTRYRVIEIKSGWPVIYVPMSLQTAVELLALKVQQATPDKLKRLLDEYESAKGGG